MMHLASYKGPANGLLHRLTHWLITHLKPKTWFPYVPADYSHNELVFSIQDNWAECASSSSRDGGVRFKQIDLFSGRWDVKPLPQYSDADELVARFWFVSHEGDKYDYLGVAAFIKTISFFVRGCLDRWFCSEAIAAALGLPNPSSLSPQDLDNTLSLFAADYQFKLTTAK
jgi:hypothetical protein